MSWENWSSDSISMTDMVMLTYRIAEAMSEQAARDMGIHHVIELHVRRANVDWLAFALKKAMKFEASDTNTVAPYIRRVS